MSELVTVFRSRNPLELQMIRTALEAAGVICHIEGDHQAGYTGMFDIPLVVRASDEAFARELLEEFRANAQLEPADETSDDGGEDGGDGDD